MQPRPFPHPPKIIFLRHSFCLWRIQWPPIKLGQQQYFLYSSNNNDAANWFPWLTSSPPLFALSHCGWTWFPLFLSLISRTLGKARNILSLEIWVYLEELYSRVWVAVFWDWKANGCKWKIVKMVLGYGSGSSAADQVSEMTTTHMPPPLCWEIDKAEHQHILRNGRAGLWPVYTRKKKGTTYWWETILGFAFFLVLFLLKLDYHLINYYYDL